MPQIVKLEGVGNEAGLAMADGIIDSIEERREATERGLPADIRRHQGRVR